MNATEKETFVRELFNNFPEHAQCLVCTGWDYEKFLFDFIDEEDGKKYTVTLPMALEAFDKLCAEIEAGKLKFDLPADYKTDTCYWDCWPIDALAQMAIFGEVIYG